jgi:opacity protein-like surface antigen
MRMQLNAMTLHRKSLAVGLRLAFVFVVTTSVPWTAAADEASGRWTGNAELRGNYYLERSTRVMMPAARVNVEAPNGIRVRGTYVLDVIASASIAQTGGEEDGVFTELRHGIGQMLVGKKIDTGSSELDLGVHGTYSTEDDYTSLTYGIYGTIALFEKNTTLGLAVTRVDDTIESNVDPTFEGKFSGMTFGFGFQQLLSPVLKLDLVYQMTHFDGFLGNPYRRALVGGRARPGSTQLMGGLPRNEMPPDERWRHNLEGQLSWYLPQTSTTLQLYLRGYTDSWDIQALTPEPRIYQQFGDFLLRMRYRFYTQTRAEFAPADGQTAYPVGYEGPVTSDPKMTRFHSHQVGLRLAYKFAVFGDSALDFARDLVVDASIDRGWSTSSFSHYWVASIGARLPW